jgi:hypothetical protein
VDTGQDTSDELAGFEAFVQGEMPPRVRHELEQRISVTLGPVDETVRSQLLNIVKDTQISLIREYRSIAERQRQERGEGSFSKIQSDASQFMADRDSWTESSLLRLPMSGYNFSVSEFKGIMKAIAGTGKRPQQPRE